MENKHILFIHIPKCAGSTISSYYELNQQIANGDFVYNFDNNSNVTFGHADINLVLKKNILSLDFYNKSFKFCIVRNPYDRVVSLFHYLKNVRLEIMKDMSFEDWIKYLYENKNNIPKNSDRNIEFFKKINNQWNLLSSWIPDDIDKIYYFEDGLATIINDINNKLGLKHNKKVGHANQSKHNHFSKYYNKETQNMIYEIYKEDFIRFNYSKTFKIIN